MRTTVTLEDDAAAVARRYAEEHEVTLGQAITALIRIAHAESLRSIEYPEWLHPLPYRPQQPIITTELIKRLQDELP